MENYLGEIQQFCGDYAPRDWVFCDGRLLPIKGNEALFELLGIAYGGDGVNNFAVPDLRSRVPIHISSNYPLGVRGGAEQVMLTAAQLPAHTHIAHVSTGNSQNNNGPANGFWAANSGAFMYGNVPGDVSMNTGTTTSTGGSMSHENRVPFVAINFIIATSGIEPEHN